MSEGESVEDEAWYVNSLARGLAVLLAFSERREAMSTSQIAEACGMSRAAARRFLLTLEELGYLRSVNNRFVLSVKALNLGYAYLSSTGVTDLIQPSLEKLTSDCGETCSLAILDDGEVVYIARTPTQRMISLRVGIGSRIPAYASSLGKAILAFLDEGELRRVLSSIRLKRLTEHTITDQAAFMDELQNVRRNGYAVTVSELEYGVASIAVPILGSTGAVVAAVNVSTQANMYDAGSLSEKFLGPLKSAKQQIEAALKAAPNFSLGLSQSTR